MEPRVTIRMIRQRLEAQMLHGARSFWRSSTSIDGRWLLFQSVLRETRFIASASSVCVCVCVWFLFPLEKNSATFTAFWWLGSVHLNLLAPLTMFEKKNLSRFRPFPSIAKALESHFDLLESTRSDFCFTAMGFGLQLELCWNLLKLLIKILKWRCCQVTTTTAATMFLWKPMRRWMTMPEKKKERNIFLSHWNSLRNLTCPINSPADSSVEDIVIHLSTDFCEISSRTAIDPLPHWVGAG